MRVLRGLGECPSIFPARRWCAALLRDAEVAIEPVERVFLHPCEGKDGRRR